MKISSINNYNHTQRQQSFNGLWSKTISHATDINQASACPEKREVSYYHPFLDETDEQIREVVNKNSSSQIVKGDGNTRLLLIRDCRVCAPILTTQKDYDKYMALENLQDFTNKHRSTHVMVKDKFINSGFNSDPKILDIIQDSAVNEKITNALQQINTIA